MASYKLSRRADHDIDAIFIFGVERFGIEQATEYLLGLHDHFERLTENPDVWPHITVQKQSFQRSVYQSHAIYYQNNGDYLLIVRVLGQQDIDKALTVSG